MKKVAVLVLSVVLFWACQSSAVKQTKQIIVYGSNNCDHCVKFRYALDSVGFVYDFRDVEFDDAMNLEMVNKVRSANIPGGFSYPVIDLEGRILVAPEIKQVIELM